MQSSPEKRPHAADSKKKLYLSPQSMISASETKVVACGYYSGILCPWQEKMAREIVKNLTVRCRNTILDVLDKGDKSPGFDRKKKEWNVIMDAKYSKSDAAQSGTDDYCSEYK